MASNPHIQPFALLYGERIEEYRPGGLHPVQIGDIFKDGQYKVVRKLGHGAFSTVWLVQDTKHGRSQTFAALKVRRSESPSNDRELRMHDLLLTPGDHKRPQDYIVTLLDSFQHTGPNGQHTCLVLEPMGPDTTTLIKQGSRSRCRIPYEEARSIVRQLLLGLDCLHQRQIAYSDMKFGNLLRTLESPWLEDERDIDHSPRFPRDAAAPTHMHEDHPLTLFVDNCAAVRIKLSDLGAAFPFSQPPEKPVVPIALRAPEIILGCDVNHRIDIWSFGCLVFEILTGSQLFGVYPLPFMKDAQIDDEHMVDMVGALGPLPSNLFARWNRGLRYFNSDQELVRSDAGEDETPKGDLYRAPSLDERFLQRKPQEMSAQESSLALHFLRRVLQYDPTTRPTTAQLLEDPWIQSIVEDI